MPGSCRRTPLTPEQHGTGREGLRLKPLKTVFHVHTDYSDDSENSVDHLIEAAKRYHIDCLVVTDHDTVEGARALAEEAGPDLKVIIGQEISTSEGHLIGLFLREAVEPGMSPRQTAKTIKDQHGLVVVPHPFNILFGCSLRDAVYDIIDLLDLVEISNAQNLLPYPNHKAEQLARRFGFPGLLGVDCHHQDSVNSCYQYLAPFDGPASFLAAVSQARLVRGRHSLGYFFRSGWFVARTKGLGLGYPDGYGRNCGRSRGQLQPRPVPVRT